MTKKFTRAFVARPRCIYTGFDLDPADEKLKPSHEHIIPLALGGSNQLVTNDVSAAANSRAGNEIDDAVSSLLPFLMLRHRYGLQGNRKTIPNVKLSGEFLDIDAPARLDIAPNGDLSFQFENEQRIQGQIISLSSTEERVRFLLKGRLIQAQKRQLSLITPFGEIADEEDIEIALMLAERNEGKEFKGRITINVPDYHFAVARLVTKIALGLGHRVLGPEWTFGPGGHTLRQNIWRRPGVRGLTDLRGTLHADLPENLTRLFGPVADHHVMSVLPGGKKTVAVIALFGGEAGTAIIDLGYDSRRLVGKALKKGEPFHCAFAIPLQGSRTLRSLSLQEIAGFGVESGLIPETRAAARLEMEMHRETQADRMTKALFRRGAGS